MNIPVIYEDDHVLVVSKPEHIPTHAPNQETTGIVEILNQQRNIQLGVHQRLDAETSGVIAFSKSQQGAKLLSAAFELRDVKKVYRAIVCGCPKQKSGQWIHYLKHENGLTRESDTGKQAKSRYRVLKSLGPFALLELELLTGITHQLRVQCALEDCPILGDRLYGGGNLAPRLYLHATSLRLLNAPNLPTFRAPLPESFESPSLPQILRPILEQANILISPYPDSEAIRVFAPNHSGIPEIVVEKIAQILLIRHLEPEIASLWTLPALQTFISLAQKSFHCKESCYRVHSFAKTTKSCAVFEKSLNQTPSPLNATENGIYYTFELSSNATGLYLDQRDNRQWIAEHAHGNVLNLFAYTCAFSVCAATSKQVLSTTSIDAVTAALQRGRKNFELNHLSLEGHRFITEDVFKYLAKCAKNNLSFDTVICDPPSFGRFNKVVFSLEKDLEQLLESCLRIAAPDAVFFFSINHRKIRLQRLKTAWKQAVKNLGIRPKSVEIFINDNIQSPLEVGTDLKTIRAIL